MGATAAFCFFILTELTRGRHATPLLLGTETRRQPGPADQNPDRAREEKEEKKMRDHLLTT